MTLALDSGLIGCQTPRLFHYPDTSFPLYNTTLADDAVDCAYVLGYDLLDWQEDLLRRSYGRNERDKWVARSVLLIITRQQGKTELIEVREATGLILLNERIFHTSQQAKTNSQAWLSLRNRLYTVPDLAALLDKPKNGGEEVSIRRATLKRGDPGGRPGDEGGFVRYISRNKDSGRGFTEIDLVIYDEAYALTDVEMGALKPTQSASRNPQTWYASSAGTEDSEVLTRQREAGMAGSNPQQLYAEWSLPEGSDPTKRELWPTAKPSLGADFCPVENLESDFQEMDLKEFAREHMGMWDDPRMNSVIDLNAWDERTEPDVDGVPPEIPVDWIVAALDVAPDRSSWSATICGKRPDGRHHGEVVAHESGGTTGILPTFQKLRTSSNAPRAVAVQAGGRAGDFGPELEQIGFKVVYFGSREIANATGQLEDDVTGGKLSHLDDPFLFDGLAGATKYQIGGDEERSGGWGWLRKNSAVDITGIVAFSYANRLLTLESVEETLAKKKRHRMW
ncbi:hypothetical protein [Mycobacteroides abscessus]|uniref:hypothetical protein n=1 Tax=Mycobacteroides abscessus TaxID=36809 RepID=UPI0002E6A5C2|nr:hypothetical protein [Mycobacteroides abscessus]